MPHKIPVDYLGILLAAGLMVGYYFSNAGVFSEAVSVMLQNPNASWMAGVAFGVIFVLCYAKGNGWLQHTESKPSILEVEEGS